VRQNLAFSGTYLSQTWENRPLTCKGFFRAFPNLFRIRIGAGAAASGAARAAVR
jgi:hypothetical protein